MTLKQLKHLLAEHPGHTLRFVLPTGTTVPPHAHVTEVAQIDKRFIDCGGTVRTESLCRLQTWFADDTEHRLTSDKLLKILEKSRAVIHDDALEVEIEHEAPFISQFPIAKVEAKTNSLVFSLGVRRTDCLAKDSCAPSKPAASASFRGLPSLDPTVCCASGC